MPKPVQLNLILKVLKEKGLLFYPAEGVACAISQNWQSNPQCYRQNGRQGNSLWHIPINTAPIRIKGRGFFRLMNLWRTHL